MSRPRANAISPCMVFLDATTNHEFEVLGYLFPLLAQQTEPSLGERLFRPWIFSRQLTHRSPQTHWSMLLTH
ncbi:unnamed protein product [Dicrocoelium dendriticum]|nr:unnamed protein product [Dicrocoelium dendriticum]